MVNQTYDSLGLISTGRNRATAGVNKLNLRGTMKIFPFRDEDFLLWELIFHTRDAIFKARQKELAEYNILTRQSAVLSIVQAIGQESTPAEISRRLLRESQTVSELLSRMEKQGLVKRVRDLRRKNQLRVMLTEKGLEVYNQSIKRESIHKIISVLSEEERQQLKSCLQKILVKALKELGLDYKISSLHI